MFQSHTRPELSCTHCVSICQIYISEDSNIMGKCSYRSPIGYDTTYIPVYTCLASVRCMNMYVNHTAFSSLLCVV